MTFIKFGQQADYGQKSLLNDRKNPEKFWIFIIFVCSPNDVKTENKVEKTSYGAVSEKLR